MGIPAAYQKGPKGGIHDNEMVEDMSTKYIPATPHSYPTVVDCSNVAALHSRSGLTLQCEVVEVTYHVQALTIAAATNPGFTLREAVLNSSVDFREKRV